MRLIRVIFLRLSHAKTCGYDDEATGVFLLRQNIHSGGTVFGGDGQNGAIHLRQIFHYKFFTSLPG